MSNTDQKSTAPKKTWLTPLGHMAWQGVGAIVGIIAVVVTVLVACSPSNHPDTNHNNLTQSGGSGNVQAPGGGNCIIAGGSGNSCNVKPSPTPATGASLKITALPLWPMLKGCDGATEVAMLDHTLLPASMKLDPAQDVRTTMMKNGGVPYGFGTLYLDFSVSDGSVADIDNIRPIFYSVHATPTPTWVYDPQGGCGDTYGRVFSLNLDKRALKDIGVQGSQTDSDPTAPSAALGKAFNITKKSPAVIEIHVLGCDKLYTWGIEVTYVIDGVEYQKTLGTATNPYRTMGVTHTTAAYSQIASPGTLTRMGSPSKPYGC